MQAGIWSGYLLVSAESLCVIENIIATNAVNNILYNIVKSYNKQEQELAKSERRKPELLPKISAHILRHTGVGFMMW